MKTGLCFTMKYTKEQSNNILKSKESECIKITTFSAMLTTDLQKVKKDDKINNCFYSFVYNSMFIFQTFN